jgi:anti-sigma B factor antagonist
MTVVSYSPSATVVLDGEIDIATAPAIRRFLMAAISGGAVHLDVDISGVAFIGAAGIGVLVAAANRAREAGGSLSLLAPSPQVRRLLDVCRKDEGRCGFQAPASMRRVIAHTKLTGDGQQRRRTIGSL